MAGQLDITIQHKPGTPIPGAAINQINAGANGVVLKYRTQSNTIRR